MYHGYNRIFWGIFFVTFHINIGPVKILPVFIGYLIIYSGLRILIDSFTVEGFGNRELFHKAKIFCLAAVFTSLIGGLAELGVFGQTQSAVIPIIWMTAINLVELIFVYYLLNGSGALLESYFGTEVSVSFIKKTGVYLVVFSFVIISLVISFAFSLQAVMMFVTICLIVLRIWLMILMHYCKKQFSLFSNSSCQSDRH